MTEETQYPLVTFALFAYKQERYIREAVEAALAQDYPNLEIIISDDASPDGTWKIIEECLTGYRGHHRVRLNRNPRNLGVMAHINEVARLASSDVIVVGAGDDISRPDRVSRCWQVFRVDSKVHAVFSDVQKIDSAGHELGQVSRVWNPAAPITLMALIQGAGGVGIGAAYAYRMACFAWPWELPSGLVSEDKLLPLRAFLLGGVGHVADPLVSYRVSGNSLTDQLVATRQRPGSRTDHRLEVECTLRHAHHMGFIRDAELSESISVLKSLPRINQIDAFTRNWPRWARSSALRILGNLVQWRSLPARAKRKFKSGKTCDGD